MTRPWAGSGEALGIGEARRANLGRRIDGLRFVDAVSAGTGSGPAIVNRCAGSTRTSTFTPRVATHRSMVSHRGGIHGLCTCGWTSGVPAATAPALDPEQQQVVDHRHGPLLVLAGPGTGKTTTIVESVVARLDEGSDPESIVVLTFGRRAATELRDRIASRRGGGLLPQVATFHSFAYGLVRSTRGEQEYLDPPRLLSGAEEDQRIRDLIKGSLDDGSVAWPEDLREALGTHGLAVEVRTLIARMRERDLSPAQLRALADAHNRPAWAAVLT